MSPDKIGPSDDEATSAVEMGRHLRTLRRMRGLSLRATAELSGLSPAFLSMVENGERALSRISHVLALARTLRVNPGDLLGQPSMPTRKPTASIEAHAAVPALRLTLLGAPSHRPTRPSDTASVEELGSLLDQAVLLINRCEYSAVVRLLPDLLERLHSAAEARPVSGHQAILWLLLRAYQSVCASVLLILDYPDLAAVAVERAASYAEQLDDPVESAINEYWRARVGKQVRAYAYALRTSEMAANTLATHPLREPRALAAYGGLHMLAALTYAGHDAENSRAFDHFAEAERTCARIDSDGHKTDLLFSRLHIPVNRLEFLGLLGRHHDVVHLGRLPVVIDPRVVTCRTVVHTTLGYSYAHLSGQEHRAITHLLHAERIAPQHVADDRQVRQAVSRLLTRPVRGQVGYDIRSLAYRIGL